MHANAHTAWAQLGVGLQLQVGRHGFAHGLQALHVLRVQADFDGLRWVVQLLNARLNQALNGLSRNLQLGAHQLFCQVQGQAFEGLEKALGVLADAAQLNAQMADEFAFFVSLGVQLGV